METKTIDLLDLLKQILHKWKTLIIVMAVCCLALTLFGTVRSVVQVQEIRTAYEQQQAAGGPVEGEALIVVPKVVWVDPFNVIIGLLLGAIGVAAVVTVHYVLSRNLRVKEDMQNLFGVTVLGSIYREKESEEQKNRIDIWVDNLFREKRTPEFEMANVDMMCTDIRLFAQKIHVNKLFLTSSCKDEDTRQAIAMFQHKLNGAVDEVVAGNSVIDEPLALEQMVHADGVVLFEKVGASTYRDIKREIAYCKRYQIAIVGCAVIE